MSFVYLRCPYRRLVSVFLDKVCKRIYSDEWTRFLPILKRGSTWLNHEAVTFETFVQAISATPVSLMNHHWRPQTEFLMFDQYSNYFSAERFDEGKRVLQEMFDVPMIDTRAHLGHHISEERMLTWKTLKN